MVATHSGVTLMPAMAKRKNDGIVYIPFGNAKYNRAIGLVWRASSLYAAELQEIAQKLKRDDTQD
jgi:hypothetical protein